MNISNFSKIQPVEYHRRFYEQNIRPDGRSFTEQRTRHVKKGVLTNADGSSQVKMGETIVTCGIKAELAEPNIEALDEGIVGKLKETLVVNVDLPSICDPQFQPGAPSEQTQVLTESISRIIQKSQMIDTKLLVIQEKKVCWVLYIDVLCLSNDGNLLDACLLSIVEALKDLKLPKVTQEEQGFRKSHNEFFQLQSKAPLSLTFGFMDSYILVDPSAAEEEICSSKLSICIDEFDEIASLTFSGISSLTREKIEKCMQIAQNWRKNTLLI